MGRFVDFLFCWGTAARKFSYCFDMPLLSDESSEKRYSKAGYDITPLTIATQQSLAKDLSPHQR
jgi:hypothetical protein